MIEVYSSSGELLFSADSVEERHLLMSGQVKRFRFDHVPSLKYYSGVDPDDGPLVPSPAGVQGGNGVAPTRVFVPRDNERDVRSRGIASGVYFEHVAPGRRNPDPARPHREREALEKSDRSEVPCRG